MLSLHIFVLSFNMNRLEQIAIGWGNFAKEQLGLLDKKTKKLVGTRLSICDKCLIRSGSICSNLKYGINIKTKQKQNGCGCILIAKTMVKDARCPLDKW